MIGDLLTYIVWTLDTFEKTLELIKNSQNICVLDFDQHFSYKYFLNIDFAREISLKW